MDVKKRLQFIEAKDRLLTVSILLETVRKSEAIQASDFSNEHVNTASNAIFEAISVLESEELKFLKEAESKIKFEDHE